MCQVPGNGEMCMTKQYVVTGDPCCEGSSCDQWIGKNGNAGHFYCQYKDCIPSGGGCDVSDIYFTYFRLKIIFPEEEGVLLFRDS